MILNPIQGGKASVFVRLFFSYAESILTFDSERNPAHMLMDREIGKDKSPRRIAKRLGVGVRGVRRCG